MQLAPARRLLISAALVAAASAWCEPAPAEPEGKVPASVPVARNASGILIYGDAWTWWDQADGRYERGHKPRVGSVVAFAKQSRLPLGHVAVVSRIVEKRVLMLTRANWSHQDGERGHIVQDVTLFDVSRRNDWSEVKVWYRDSNGLGSTIYEVNGFIYPADAPAPGLNSREPDYVGVLVDPYTPGSPPPKQLPVFPDDPKSRQGPQG